MRNAQFQMKIRLNLVSLGLVSLGFSRGVGVKPPLTGRVPKGAGVYCVKIQIYCKTFGLFNYESILTEC